MNKYIVLTKTLFKNGFSPIPTDRKKKIRYFLFIALIILSLIPLGVSLSQFTAKIYDALSTINQEGIILGTGFSLVSAAIFFFGIFYIFSVFYFAKDIENLLYLPLLPSQILCSKFTVALVYEYITELIFLVPLIITFGVKSHSGILYYIYSLIIFLILPIIPLVIASIIDMIIMRFTNIGKNKDKFRIISGIIGIFIIIFLNSYMQKFNTNLTQQDLLEMLSKGNNSMIELSTRLFPTSSFQAQALINSYSFDGFINLVAFLAITLIFLIVFAILGEVLYFKGVIGVSESFSKRKILKEHEFQKETREKSPVWSYTQKELKLLFRTPSYFMNCVLMNFIWPVFFIVPIIFQPNAVKEFDKILELIKNPSFSGAILAGVFSVSLFITSTNGVTPSAISREGQNIYVNKYLPISYKDQLIAKALSGTILGAVGTFIMVITAWAIFKPSLYLIIFSLVLSILGILFSSFIGLMLDLYNPKLIWDHEQKAVKQNFNVLFGMVISIISATIIMAVVISFNIQFWSALLLISTVFLALDIILYKLITTKGVQLFENIEG